MPSPPLLATHCHAGLTHPPCHCPYACPHPPPLATAMQGLKGFPLKLASYLRYRQAYCLAYAHAQAGLARMREDKAGLGCRLAAEGQRYAKMSAKVTGLVDCRAAGQGRGPQPPGLVDYRAGQGRGPQPPGLVDYLQGRGPQPPGLIVWLVAARRVRGGGGDWAAVPTTTHGLSSPAPTNFPSPFPSGILPTPPRTHPLPHPTHPAT